MSADLVSTVNAGPHTTEAPRPAAPPPLRRNWRFQALWVGSGTSLLGLTAADFAYPVVILLMTGSPALAAMFGFIQMTATILAGLPAGALVDRLDRRHALMASEALRAVTTGSIVAAWALGGLTLAHIFVVAAILGAVTPFGSSARMLMVRAVVPKEQLTQALTQDEVRTAAAGLAGPPLGGVLLAASRGLPFLATSLTFVVSFVTALVVRVPEETHAAEAEQAASATRQAERNETGGMFAGIVALWRDRTMRSALGMISLINVGGSALFLAIVVLLRDGGASPRLIGVAVAGEAVGSLLGAGLVGRLHRRVAPGWLLIGIGTMFALLIPLLAVPLGPWWVFGVLATATLGVPALRVLLDVLILRRVPDAQRGRTITAVMTVITIGIPFGTLAGGLALQFAGATATILAIAGLTAFSVIAAASDPRLRHAQWPTAQ